MLREIYKDIRNYFFKLRFKCQGKQIRFLKHTVISKTCFFEGYNSVGENTKLLNCYIGQGTYMCENLHLLSVKIGRFCSLGSQIHNTRGNHPTSIFVSTHPSFFSTQKTAGFTFSDKNKFNEFNYLDNGFLVEIGNDVWIGDNVTIKDGVKIGDGAIIGSNSLVVSDIDPYSINVGIPSRRTRYRFSENDIELLLDTKWWDKDFDWIKNNSNLFEDIEKFKAEILLNKKNK